ncbi:pantoate--beta-alanine ligase [Nocardia sp. NPDC052566]|uniref:pantoate--beta-alanine ligase n=1 Tax=Nocardia sp. NPDC052566 TaxID=3364330 RepID=UPI0037C8ED85
MNILHIGNYAPDTVTVHHDPATMTAVSEALRAAGRDVALVPTMGALHAGHLRLVEKALERHPEVIVSIFVNPFQFGPGEDFERYPRTLDSDVEQLRATGARLVFAPNAADMYPEGWRTVVTPGAAGSVGEGATRPTLFGGILTVVAKLLRITRPRTAFFGEKDYQQLVLIGQMARDLFLDVEVVGVPTVREPDGLAMSSRNQYLVGSQRDTAVAMWRALNAGCRAGGRGADAVCAAAREVLAATEGVKVEYVEVTAPDMGPAPTAGPGRLLLAAHVGNTRLVDNAAVTLGVNSMDE